MGSTVKVKNKILIFPWLRFRCCKSLYTNHQPNIDLPIPGVPFTITDLRASSNLKIVIIWSNSLWYSWRSKSNEMDWSQHRGGLSSEFPLNDNSLRPFIGISVNSLLQILFKWDSVKLHWWTAEGSHSKIIISYYMWWRDCKSILTW